MLSYQGHVIGQLQFTVMPTNITAEDGMETTLPCVATGAPPIIYVWYRDNITAPLALISNNSERVYITDGNLTFTEVTDDDEDVYICMAIDGRNNRITSDPIYLTGRLHVNVLIWCITETRTSCTIVMALADIAINSIGRPSLFVYHIYELNKRHPWYDTLYEFSSLLCSMCTP